MDREEITNAFRGFDVFAEIIRHEYGIMVSCISEGAGGGSIDCVHEVYDRSMTLDESMRGRHGLVDVQLDHIIHASRSRRQ